MDNLIQADIFFFIASIALILVSIIFIIALFYLIKFLRDAKEVMNIIRYEAEMVSEDIESIRDKIHEGNFSLGSIFSLFMKLRKKGRKKLK